MTVAEHKKKGARSLLWIGRPVFREFRNLAVFLPSAAKGTGECAVFVVVVRSEGEDTAGLLREVPEEATPEGACEGRHQQPNLPSG